METNAAPGALGSNDGLGGERAAFEAWWDSMDHAPYYKGIEKRIAHTAWQARAALAAAPVTCQTYGPGVKVPCAECNQTLVDSQELAALRKDAERYRWLKKQFRVMSLNMSGNHVWVQASSGALRGHDMDAACDAGMALHARVLPSQEAKPDGFGSNERLGG